MVVNFRTRGISRGARKLVQTFTLKKKKKVENDQNFTMLASVLADIYVEVRILLSNLKRSVWKLILDNYVRVNGILQICMDF
jgi:hypothetical protein